MNEESELYKIEFGRFETQDGIDYKLLKYIAGGRTFIPVFEQVLSKKEMIDKLMVFIKGWRDEYFDEWLHYKGRERTFMEGEDKGYRITKVHA